MHTPQTELRKATAYIRKASTSAAAAEAFSPASENRTLDPRLIHSEQVTDLAAVESANERSPGGSSQFTAQTRLGSSAIKHINLNQLIESLFFEEYDPNQIIKHCNAMYSRRDFHYAQQDLGM